MADSDWLAAAFEEHRDHLRAVAYRLLGSMSRCRRRGPGHLAAADRRGYQRGGEPRRLADDGRRAGVPQHAPVAPLPARGTGR